MRVVILNLAWIGGEPPELGAYGPVVLFLDHIESIEEDDGCTITMVSGDTWHCPEEAGTVLSIINPDWKDTK